MGKRSRKRELAKVSVAEVDAARERLAAVAEFSDDSNLTPPPGAIGEELLRLVRMEHALTHQPTPVPLPPSGWEDEPTLPGVFMEIEDDDTEEMVALVVVEDDIMKEETA